MFGSKIEFRTYHLPVRRPFSGYCQVLFFYLLFTFYFSTLSFSQQITQNIRGKVIDRDARIPLPGANLVIKGSDPQIGTTTDLKGEFKFENLPVGKYTIIVYYVGYETTIVPNVALRSGKETVLTIALTESVQSLNEVVISPGRNGEEPLNEMAAVSVMKFDVKAMDHFAGTINDAARVVSSFAGVAMNPSGANDIIIRGNSPRGMMWRLEGLDIPNPNHYAEEGSSGGGLSMLNASVLANSDFFTGAFPAQYGNAYSGIFDMRLRNGNNQSHEYSLQAGFIGLDCTFEGPFSPDQPSSYLINYRFSSLAALQAVGFRIVGDAIPYFQDLTFKLHFPTKGYGAFSVFGIGGFSNVHEEERAFSNDFSTGTGVIGLKNVYYFNKSTYMTGILAYTHRQNEMDYKEPGNTEDYMTKATEKILYQTPKISVVFNKKFDAKNLLQIGAIGSFINYNLESAVFDPELEELVTQLDHQGATTLLESFVTWRHRFNKDMTLIAGLHNMNLMLNTNYTIEPRIGFRWKFAKAQTFNVGLGLHSKMEPLSTYYAQQAGPDGSVFLPNKNLDFIKALHIVAGYENMIDDDLLMKIELYYQRLFDVPVEDSESSSFSVLNFNSGYTNRTLVNRGGGRNTGLEFTMEKYFSNDYYYMVTLSLFDSKYKALDGEVRNTRYNLNHILNLIGGKDFSVGNGLRKRILGINLKGTWSGGQWHTPIDIEKSKIEGRTVRDQRRAFTEQWPDFFRFDFKVYLSRNRKKATHTVELDIQNFTNQLNIIGDYYNYQTGDIETITQMGIVPILNYRVEF